jgi:hypothetical protein
VRFESLRRLTRYVIPCLVGVFLGGLYLRTLAPDLTWAFDGADGGDLVTAAAVGGVPHPTGYPTYLVIASAFLRLPWGSPAYRTNLMSAVCTVAAALVIYSIVWTVDRRMTSAAVAALAFGTFPLIWSQAIITEVNALHALFVTLNLYLLVVVATNPRMDLLGGLTLGLGMGNHASTVLLLPFIFFHGRARTEPPTLGRAAHSSMLTGWSRVARRAVAMFLGLGVYLLLPLRAQSHPPVNWGDAVDWNGLTWLVTGKMYWSRLGNLDWAYLSAGLKAWSGFMVHQLGVMGFLLIVATLAVLLSKSSLFLATCWLIVAQSVLAIVYDSPDSYVYLIPALVALSIWMGLGAGWFTNRASRISVALGGVAAVGISAFFVVRAALAVPAMDLSGDHTAVDFAHAILTSAPQKGIILAEGDEATFVLWYFHYAEHKRPDVALVSKDLFVQVWYHFVLKDTYPDLVVPNVPWGLALAQANPSHPFCRLPAGLQPGLECTG